MVEIIDYDKKYALELDQLDYEYWGTSETDKVSEEIEESDIVKLAISKEKLVGVIHFKVIGDLIDAYHILVDQNYQKQGIATNLMDIALKESKQKGFKTVIAHAVEHEGKINAEKLLKKFNFSELYKIKNYWEALYPWCYCKQCNSTKCHCGVVVYQKNL